MRVREAVAVGLVAVVLAAGCLGQVSPPPAKDVLWDRKQALPADTAWFATQLLRIRQATEVQVFRWRAHTQSAQVLPATGPRSKEGYDVFVADPEDARVSRATLSDRRLMGRADELSWCIGEPPAEMYVIRFTDREGAIDVVVVFPLVIVNYPCAHGTMLRRSIRGGYDRWRRFLERYSAILGYAARFPADEVPAPAREHLCPIGRLLRSVWGAGRIRSAAERLCTVARTPA